MRALNVDFSVRADVTFTCLGSCVADGISAVHTHTHRCSHSLTNKHTHTQADALLPVFAHILSFSREEERVCKVNLERIKQVRIAFVNGMRVRMCVHALLTQVLAYAPLPPHARPDASV